MDQKTASALHIRKGVCHALFAYDVGLSINLAEADRSITAIKERGAFRHKLRAPQHLEYRPAPLRIIQESTPLALGRFATNPAVEIVLYDFGALSVNYTISCEGRFSELLALSQILYEHPELRADARRRIELLLAAIVPAVDRPSISGDVEDYLIYEFDEPLSEDEQTTGTGQDQALAKILRSEPSPLSDQQVKDAISYRISYGPDDDAIIDWNATLLFGRDMEDVRAVLEFANVELLEMRLLDQQLDNALDQAYEALSKKPKPLWTRFMLPGRFETDSKRIARLQVDSAILFARVTNTLKLVGDQYLARVYRLVSQRFHLETWDASIARKLHTLDSIYGKMTDRAAVRRMEVLEWIIIVLIALSIAVSFHP